VVRSGGWWFAQVVSCDEFVYPYIVNDNPRHWPIGLIYDNHVTSSTVRQQQPLPTSQTVPLRLILHLASPPTDKLLLAPSAEACKQAFMGQLKEADFIRWGNTKRMTGLRKAEQDGIWEGIRERMCWPLLCVVLC
jgi:autophagy-related protein 5